MESGFVQEVHITGGGWKIQYLKPSSSWNLCLRSLQILCKNVQKKWCDERSHKIIMYTDYRRFEYKTVSFTRFTLEMITYKNPNMGWINEVDLLWYTSYLILLLMIVSTMVIGKIECSNKSIRMYYVNQPNINKAYPNGR